MNVLIGSAIIYAVLFVFNLFITAEFEEFNTKRFPWMNYVFLIPLLKFIGSPLAFIGIIGGVLAFGAVVTYLLIYGIRSRSSFISVSILL